MGSDSGGRYSYTGANAERYGSFGIEGTTYQIGFDAVAELLGDIRGKTFLDFGCGAGRSARFLKRLGARHVYAVDHDQNMIDQGLARELDGVTFLHIDSAIPLPDASVDGAVSMNVFIEIRTLGAMTRACAEIARTMRPVRRSCWNPQARWRSATRSGASATRTPGRCGAATRLLVS